MMYDYYYSYFNPLHFLSSVIGWVLIFLIILWLIRLARGKGHYMHRHGFGGDSAMDTLRGRYAKGEIDKKEFEERKKDLMS